MVVLFLPSPLDPNSIHHEFQVIATLGASSLSGETCRAAIDLCKYRRRNERAVLDFDCSYVLFAGNVRSQTSPLKLVQTIKLPAEIKGRFDHFAVDLSGNRLFATPEDNHAVLVFELKSGKLLRTIKGIGKPHAILYRQDLNQIYVTDGDAGDLKIFDSKTYTLKSSVKLLEDADSIGYDPVTKYLYIDNGGGDVHETYSMLSVVDTTSGAKLG